MKSTLFGALSTVAAVGSAIAIKGILGKLWPEGGPPKNPADRSISWKSAIQWAIVSSLGAGIGRLVARRLTAAGWERTTGDLPPGLQRAS